MPARISAELMRERRLAGRLVARDSTILKLHPDVTEALKQSGAGDGRSHGGWTTKLHLPC